MIEFPVQPTQPLPPCIVDPTQIGDLDGIDFAAQLSVLTSKPSVMDVLPGGKAPPPSGKPLPPVADPLEPLVAEPPVEPEAVLAGPVPIMRPLQPHPKLTATPLPESVAVAAGVQLVSEKPLKARSEVELPIDVAASMVTAPILLDVPAPSPARSAVQEQPQTAPTPPPPGATVAQSSRPLPVSSSPPNETTEAPAPRQAAPNRPLLAAESTPIQRALANKAAVLILEPAAAMPASVELVAQQQAVRQPGAAPLRNPGLRHRAEAGASLAATAIKAQVALPVAIDLQMLRPRVQQASAVPIELTAPQQAAAFAPTSLQPTAPQDFAALIDRIVAAREASGSPVAVTVRHAEFGAVNLRFEQADSSLTVAATSPDPEFARAAAAALPAERPAPLEAATREGGKQSSQHEAGAGGGSSGQPQRQSSTAPQAQPRSRTTHSPADEARDGGLFA